MATKKKKKAKGPSLMDQAKNLGSSKYAPVLSEIEGQRKVNLNLYTNAASQRTYGLNREFGSINAAGATSRKNILNLGSSGQQAYQSAINTTQSNTKDLLNQINANNSSVLSTLQADMRARGIEGYEQLSPLTQNMAEKNELLASMGQFGINRLQAAKDASQESTSRQAFMADQMRNTAGANARGAAQSDLSDLYNKFLEAKMGFDVEKKKTVLEKQDYINQMYFTLKDKAEQEAAARAQAKAAQAAAAGNLAYKYEALKVGTQYKYDKLSSDTAQQDIVNDLKERGFSHKQATDTAKLALENKKVMNQINNSKTSNADLLTLLGLR